MKWLNGYEINTRSVLPENWELWYAWHPVCIGVDPKTLRRVKVWREYVERCRYVEGYCDAHGGPYARVSWKYRGIEK